MAAPNSGNSVPSTPSTASSPTASESDGSEPSDSPPAPGASAFPWLMLPEPASPLPSSIVGRSFYHIPSGQASVYALPGEDSRRCVASAHGWIIFSAVDTPLSLALLNPITHRRVDLHWPFGNQYIDRLHAVLTSSPLDPECLLAVASDEIIAYCRPCPRRASTGWRTLPARGFLYDAASSDFVCVGTMVYLVDRERKLWRVDLADPDPRDSVERRDMAFPLPGGERTRHYLVESLGAVHLVLSDEHHERVSHFTMDWGRSMWVPADGSRCDCVLLLGRGCSAVVPASAAGPDHVPGTVLFAHQPSTRMNPGAVDDDGGGGGGGGGDGERVWFWAEARMYAVGQDELLVRKRNTTPPQQGQFTGDSFWFFPAIDPDEGSNASAMLL